MPVSAMFYPDISSERNWIFNGIPGGDVPVKDNTGVLLTLFSPIVFERPISFDALSVEVTGGSGTSTTSVKGAFYKSDEFGLPGTKIEHTKFSRIDGDGTKTREPITFEDYIFPAGIYWLALKAKGIGSGLSSERRVTTINPTFPGMPWLPIMAIESFQSSSFGGRAVHLVRKGEWEEELPEDISLESEYFNYTHHYSFETHAAFGIRVTAAAKSLTHAEEIRKV